MRIRAQLRNFGDSIELLMIDGANGEHINYVKELVIEKVPIGQCLEPTARMSRTEAQELMDNLWQCGLRPSEGTGSAGSLAATERHLKDMQQIAFGVLKQKGMV